MKSVFRWVSKGYGPIRAARNLAAAVIFAASPALAAPVTLLALGDSLTQGYGLAAPEDGLVPQLQAWLRAQGADVTVINAGVSGDTTAGGRARLDWSLTPDVDAVMIALGGNDLLRGLPPAEARANLEAMLATVQARGLPVLLAGLPAPGNYGAEYQAEFDAIWPDLAKKYDAVLVPNLLGPIAALSLEDRIGANLMQDDNIHPSPAGVTLVVAALGPKVLALLAKITTH
ncbi:MAG: arylesterase [Paracoccaceae bacterium]|nr:arylesterase [Paracoccaceae bacterium]